MPVGIEGYAVVHEVAVSNLQPGSHRRRKRNDLLSQTRVGWAEAAARSRARLVMVETYLPDVSEHHRRVEEQAADIPATAFPPSTKSSTMSGHPRMKSVTGETNPHRHHAPRDQPFTLSLTT
jgi:hypothetical protein